MRLIDADALIIRLYEYTEEYTYIDDDGDVIIPDFPPWIHIEIANFPTTEAIPIEWLKDNLIGTEFYFGKGVDNTLAGELVWQMIVDWWQEDNGDEWWREEQGDETD